MLRQAEIDKLVAGLAKHPQVVILPDEIYSQMLYDGREHVSLLNYPEIRDRLIVLMGGQNLCDDRMAHGLCSLPDAMVEPDTSLHHDHSCVNASAQFAGLAALTGPQDAVIEMVAQFDDRRKAIVAALNDLPGVTCTDAAGAFYAFPNITQTGLTAAQAQDLFLDKAGVATIAGTSLARTVKAMFAFHMQIAKKTFCVRLNVFARFCKHSAIN